MNAQPVHRLSRLWKILARFLAGLVLIAALVFIPAGTLHYWQAWVYMALVFVPMAVFGTVLLVKVPDVLERRMGMGEAQSEQMRALAAMGVLLVAVLLLSGFDRRYGWSTVPSGVVLLADVLVLLSYGLFVLAIRENQYASRVVELQKDQVVISTGPYAIVRHPMYLGTGLLFTTSPLALASDWGMLPALLFPVVLAVRIRNEEKPLGGSLKGYDEIRTQGQVPPRSVRVVKRGELPKTSFEPCSDHGVASVGDHQGLRVPLSAGPFGLLMPARGICSGIESSREHSSP